MANLLTFTEQFDNSAWMMPDGGTISADTDAAPTSAGPLAKLADTINATSGWHQIRQTVGKSAADASPYTWSVFIKKDAITARFPCLLLDFSGTAGYARGMNLDTVTGAIGQNASFGAPAAFGVVNADAVWWRVWIRDADPNSNTEMRAVIFPAAASSLTGGINSGLTGSAVCWGANLTPSPTLEPYTPHPFYDADASWTQVAQVGGAVGTYTDMTMRGGDTYEWRVLAANAGGSSASNHVEAYVDGAAPSFGVSRRVVFHTRRAVFRTRRV